MKLKHSALCASILGIALGVACSLAACTSSDTSIVAPSTEKCGVTISNSPSAFQAGGGAGSITIATSRDCAWSMGADAAWVSLTQTTGQGGATVPFSVAANPVPSPRSSSIAVNAQHVQITQAAAPCRYDLSRSSDSIPASGGGLSVGVTTLTGCQWTASSSVGWVAVISGSSGSASGTVGLSVAANAGGERAGQVTIAGQTYTVTQQSASSSPSPGPSPTPTPGSSPPDASAHVDGTVGAVAGACPDLMFFVNDTTVVTDSSTDFRKMHCADVKRGVEVSVDGSFEGAWIRASVVTETGKS